MIQGLYNFDLSNIFLKKHQLLPERKTGISNPDNQPESDVVDQKSGNVNNNDKLNLYNPGKIKLKSLQKDIDEFLKNGNAGIRGKIIDVLKKHHPDGIKNLKDFFDKKNSPGKLEHLVKDNLEGLGNLKQMKGIKKYVDNLSKMDTPRELKPFINSVDEMVKSHTAPQLKNTPVKVDDRSGVYDVEKPVTHNRDSLDIEMNFNLFFSLSEQIRERYGSGPQGKFHEVSKQVSGKFEMNFSLKIKGVGDFLNTTQDVVNLIPSSFNDFIDAASGLADLNSDSLDHFMEATGKFISDLKNIYGDKPELDNLYDNITSTAEKFIKEVHRGVKDVFPELYSNDNPTTDFSNLTKDLPSIIDMVRRLFGDENGDNSNILEKSLQAIRDNIEQNRLSAGIAGQPIIIEK